MINSILTSIKKLLGIDAAYTHFDEDLIIHINSIFANLVQMGVHPAVPEGTEYPGFEITDASAVWSDFINDDKLINNLKTYMYLQVRMIFDPPDSNAVMESYKNQIKELEYRLYTQKGGY